MQSWIKPFRVFDLSVSVTILLFTVKSKLSFPYNRVLRVKGAMCPIAFWSVTLGLLYRGHTRKKWNEILVYESTQARRRISKFHRINYCIPFLFQEQARSQHIRNLQIWNKYTKMTLLAPQQVYCTGSGNYFVQWHFSHCAILYSYSIHIVFDMLFYILCILWSTFLELYIIVLVSWNIVAILCSNVLLCATYYSYCTFYPFAVSGCTRVVQRFSYTFFLSICCASLCSCCITFVFTLRQFD